MPSRDFKRTDRVGAELRRELGLLVHAAVRDHALPSVSVSDVEVVLAKYVRPRPVAGRAWSELY